MRGYRSLTIPITDAHAHVFLPERGNIEVEYSTWAPHGKTSTNFESALLRIHTQCVSLKSAAFLISQPAGGCAVRFPSLPHLRSFA